MRKLLITLLAATALLVAALPGAAQDDVSDTGFDTLLAAIEAAGLSETIANDGPFTVFAPTNAAFAAALEALGLTAEELLADTDTLTSILTYHVVAGEVMAADVLALVEEAEDGVAEVPTLNGASLSISVVDGGVVINDTANVILTDVEAANGVIHAIDAVLLPPSDEEAAEITEEPIAEATEEPIAEATEEPIAEATEEPIAEATEEAAEMTTTTVVDLAIADENFSILVDAVVAAELVDALSAEGPFTVFAPTNDAFGVALDGLGLTAEELLADTETLTSILTYHVVPGNVLAADVVALIEESEDGVAMVETLNGASISISLDGGGNVVINESAVVTATDLEADNGVIHVIDAVLLPPSDEEAAADMEMTEEPAAEEAAETSEEMGSLVDVAMSDENFSTLVDAVVAAELAETLSTDGPFTVFAPTNDAFATALDDLGLTAEELLVDTETLTSILTYHVVPGSILAADVVALIEGSEDGTVSVETVNGASISIALNDEGNVVIDDVAVVTTTDLEASNGVIHVIDAVLLPPPAE